MPDSKSDTTELQLTFGEKATEALHEIQRLGRFKDIQEAMEAMIGRERFFQERRMQGWRLLLEKDGFYKEVKFDV